MVCSIETALPTTSGRKEAVVVMYTGEIGFVKKQLRLHREFSLLEEYCMQSKAGCYLFIIGVKR